jgi:sulfocyanin
MRTWTWQGMLVLAGVVVQGISASGAAAQSAPGRAPDPAWLKSDSTKKSLEFAVVAGLTGLNGGMNFDGAKDGGLTLTVPLGWTVELEVKNNDQTLPHSVEVIRDSQPVPSGPVAPAFAHAETSNISQGLAADQKQDVRFLANRPGSYLIFCAVPGHGAAGMWIRLIVSAAAARPELAATLAKP